MENSVRNMVLETIEGLYKTGSVSEITLKEVRALALAEVKPYTPRSIARLRRKLRLSQAALAKQIHKDSKSIMRMLSAHGNPTAENLFGILHVLQKREGVQYELQPV